jgi:hypothetical protein
MATISWTNPNGGDWDVASNWSTDMVPTSTDEVTIAAPSADTVTINGAGIRPVNPSMPPERRAA